MGNRSRADVRRSIHKRIRKKISGTTERPRLAVYRSSNHIYAQVIDDMTGKTLVSASSVEKDFRGAPGGNIKAAEVIGKAIAERAIGAGISEVVYDRGGYIYHGRVKALLDATRSAGLNKNESSGIEKPAKKKKDADAKEEAPAEKPAKEKASSDKTAEKSAEEPKKAAPKKKADKGKDGGKEKDAGTKKQASKKDEKDAEVDSANDSEDSNE